jgi:hypothetical protein
LAFLVFLGLQYAPQLGERVVRVGWLQYGTRQTTPDERLNEHVAAKLITDDDERGTNVLDGVWTEALENGANGMVEENWG